MSIDETISGIVSAASSDDYPSAVRLLIDFVNHQSKEKPSIDGHNKNVLNLLGHAWNAYLIANDHQTTPQDADNLNDFRKAILDAQRIVATRELQLIKPEFFK